MRYPPRSQVPNERYPPLVAARQPLPVRAEDGSHHPPGMGGVHHGGGALPGVPHAHGWVRGSRRVARSEQTSGGRPAAGGHGAPVASQRARDFEKKSVKKRGGKGKRKSGDDANLCRRRPGPRPSACRPQRPRRREEGVVRGGEGGSKASTHRRQLLLRGVEGHAAHGGGVSGQRLGAARKCGRFGQNKASGREHR